MYEITVAGQEYSKKTSSNHWVAWYLVYIYIYIYIKKYVWTNNYFILCQKYLFVYNVY